MSEFQQKKSDLTRILRYAKELLGFNRKLIWDIDRQSVLCIHESALTNLEGVVCNAGSDVWLEINRLKETQPPAPPSMFDGWIVPERHPSPDRTPQLLESRILRKTASEVESLCLAGAIRDADDVMEPLQGETAAPDEKNVLLFSSCMPDFRKAWRAYIDEQWEQWALAERPRRKSIEIYNKLYKAQQQIQAMGADNPIEMVFGVGVARWKYDSYRLSVPLIEQLVEIILEDDGKLIVKPRETDPLLNLKVFHALDLPGAKSLQSETAKSFTEAVRDPDRGFSPFDRSTFESTLRACAARLSSSGLYRADESLDSSRDAEIKECDDTLRISDTWVLYVRPRQENFREEDIERLIARVEQVDREEDLPPCGLRFVERPSDDSGNCGSLIDLSGGRIGLGEDFNHSTGESTEAAQPYFFPLPYNDDQIEIVRRLENADGVVVQGPPGTGKTHTIANIICHYMATGRRVLVTAKTAEALTALQEKLPESVRGLAISVIHNDREGASQLEAAVRILSNEAKQVNERLFIEQIQEREHQIERLSSDADRIESEIQRVAEINTQSVAYEGLDLQPMDLARKIEVQRPAFSWLEDQLGIGQEYEPRFGDDDIRQVRALRRRLDGDLEYPLDALPDPGNLPDLARVMAAHADLAEIERLQAASRSEEWPYIAASGDDTFQRAAGLRAWLADFADVIAAIVGEQWLLPSYHRLGGWQKWESPKLFALRTALEQWASLQSRGAPLALRSILIAPDEDPALDKALSELAMGRKPFGLFSMFKGGLKQKLDQITIEGRPPSSTDDWSVVHEYRCWQRDVLGFGLKWNSLAPLVEGRPLASDWGSLSSELLRLGGIVARMLAVLAEHEDRKQAILNLFPHGIDATAVLSRGEYHTLQNALEAYVKSAQLESATRLRRHVAEVGGDYPLPFHSAVRQIAENLGRTDVPAAAIADAWRQVESEARRLSARRSDFEALTSVVERVSGSGASKWAHRLLSERPSDDDPLTPADWRKAWEWARGRSFIESLPDRARVQELSRRLESIERRTRELFLDIVRLRTFVGLKQNMSPMVHSALARFIAAVSKLGKGTGKSAYRHRRVIRDSINDAVSAIPCWILPEWRVSEQLPAELCAFDLAIVDEASQSDITALAAILRSKKVLIVGDDKQVSPDVVGVEDRTIVQLRNAYLQGLPFADQMEPSTSLYELGSMVYPGKTIMLREHFRCVEPIIRFSSQFYEQPLIPLRIPTAGERLDPPIIDIYVPHGMRNRRKQNPEEAKVVVDEIVKIVNMPAMEKRSIGVISLIGQEQAKLIYDLLVSELGTEAMERHRIMCGDAATFQGQERDIILLSMVACPRQSVSQTSRRYQQRFNVAMSRARDRLILVRSVAASHLKAGDLKLKVIEHVRNPMGEANVLRPKDVLDLCQSEFEVDFAKAMMALGYRLQAQVPVAGYSLDFVIEGDENRRLAIELDGDKYHGPERWAQDIQRQKALERLGWKFWRCWGSHWISDSDGCLRDLIQTLDEAGIRPLGAAAVAGEYTMHIEVPSPSASTEEKIIQIDDLLNGLTPGLAETGATFAAGTTDQQTVAIGDLVVIRYVDAPDRAIRLRLSDRENRPEQGIVHSLEPLGSALLGASVDDEIQVTIGDVVRTAAIERIEKPSLI